MPPASSHFADKPVPAPPPTIGSPRAILSHSRLRISLRAIRGIVLLCVPVLVSRSACDGSAFGAYLVKMLDEQIGKGRVVQMQRAPDQRTSRPATEVRFDRSEQRLVRFGIPELFARCIERGHAAFGNDEAHRAVHPI